MVMSHRNATAIVVILLLITLAAKGSWATGSPADDSFAIDDYFNTKRVVELALSPDGQWLAFVVEWQSLQTNGPVRKAYVQPVVGEKVAQLVEGLDDARSLSWIPDRSELAFLSSRSGTGQLYAFDVRSVQTRRITKASEEVVKFGFAPNGNAVAYITEKLPSPIVSLHEQLRNGDSGIVIDSDTAHVKRIIDPDRPHPQDRPVATLWIKPMGEKAEKAELPGDVGEFHWSGDSTRLSVSYQPFDFSPKLWSVTRSTVAIYSPEDRDLRVVAQWSPASGDTPQTSYVGGQWIPGADEIIVRRITYGHNLWMSTGYNDWTIVDVATGSSMTASDWSEIEVYGLDGGPLFIPVDRNTIYTNKTVKAVRSLYRLKQSGTFERASMLSDVDGSTSKIRFDSGFSSAAFVNESLTRPPEIYYWQAGNGILRLTELNRHLEGKRLPNVREVNWRSKDGTPVHGWLLEPEDDGSSGESWPTITYVHGGPGVAMPDTFGFHVKWWPYPFEIFALNGIAVFVPNYRGTRTYGREFAEPSRLDGEPVDDVISGIEYLVATGTADPRRLGIAGYSHGSWLGALTMTRYRNFRAGSFAEGTANWVVLYELMPGSLNRRVHDVNMGTSLYDNPQRYIDASPVFGFQGLDTAVLFEAGAKAGVITMLGNPKAAERAGMPTEYVVYPRTGHAIKLPRFRKESAERNLDWFRFWLLGQEDRQPVKVEQYARWRAMRDKRCTQEDSEPPSYCRDN